MKRTKTERTKVERTKKIKKGDKVIVIAGNSKGQSGTVLRFIGEGVIVQGLNMKKKHVRPSQVNPKGGILEMEAPIHISNVAPADADGKRVKMKVERSGKEAKLYYMKGSEKVQVRAL